MFKETIEEIRDKVVELDNIYSDAIAVDAVSCSAVIHEFVEDIQKKLDELEKEYNTFYHAFSNACDEKDRRIRFRDSELKDAKVEIKELEKQINEKDERIEQLVAENEGMAWTSLDNITDLKLKIMEKDERIKELEEDLEAANEKAQKERNELCDEYHKQLKLHHNELRAIKEELAQKDKKIEKLYHDLDDSDREIYNLRDDNIALVERIERLENERRISLPCKLIDELQDSREKVEELTKHNDDLRKNYKVLREHIQELTQEKESLKRQVDIWKEAARKNGDLSAKRYNELNDAKERIKELEKFVYGVTVDELTKELNKDRFCSTAAFNKTADELMKKFYEGVNDALMNNKKEN